MEKTERRDAGSPPYYVDKPINAQGGKSGESGRIGQGGSELEEVDDENEVGSTRKSEWGQGDRNQNPGTEVDPSDEPPKVA